MSAASLEIEIELLLQIKKLLIEYIYLKEPETNLTNNPVIKSSSHLLTDITKRLTHFCEHNIVEDIIEIGVKTKTVFYCDKCETTF